MKQFDEIILEDIFGNPFTLRGHIIDYKTYGYNLRSGTWTKYKIYEDAEPAKFMIFRAYRKKKNSAINMNKILKVNGEKPK